MAAKYTIEQITSRHIHRYINVSPRDIGLWAYVIDGRAYGFTISKDSAIEKAEKAVGIIN